MAKLMTVGSWLYAKPDQWENSVVDSAPKMWHPFPAPTAEQPYSISSIATHRKTEMMMNATRKCQWRGQGRQVRTVGRPGSIVLRRRPPAPERNYIGAFSK